MLNFLLEGVLVVKYTQYKVVEIHEGVLGTLFLGSSKLPIKEIEDEINKYAADGWNVVFQVIESKRVFLFWQRESMILTLGK